MKAARVDGDTALRRIILMSRDLFAEKQIHPIERR
jgi:hypothetical protein